MITQKVTATANTAAQLFAFDSGRIGARVQNPFAVPIYLSKNVTVPTDASSIYVPAVNSRGDPGEYVFDGPAYEEWWYKTTVSGDFGLQMW